MALTLHDSLLFAPSWRTVIGITDFKRFAAEARLHVALEPLVEHEVKIHVGEQRADDLPLPGPRLAHQQPSVVNDSDVDPLPYQSEDACVVYPPLNHLHEMFSHDGIEVGGDVQLEDDRGLFATDDASNFVQCPVRTASGPEPVGAVTKVLLVDGREQFARLRKDASAGVDHVTYRDYEEQAKQKVQELHERLKSKTYRALPLRRIYIPKEDGKKRPISIPTVHA